MIKDLLQLSFLKGNRTKVIAIAQMLYAIGGMLSGHIEPEPAWALITTSIGLLTAAAHDSTKKE